MNKFRGFSSAFAVSVILRKDSTLSIGAHGGRLAGEFMFRQSSRAAGVPCLTGAPVCLRER